jgi:NAD(P)-dependent dehydrogenase (short-subunit alcohol dehydrogenase family)
MTQPGRALEQRAALVTGGGSGIGLACARALLHDGAHVTIAGRNEARLRAAADELGRADDATARLQWVVCDITDEDAVAAAVARAATPTGALDIAVANAGGGMGGALLSTTLEMWRDTIDLNLTGTFLTIKHAGLAMRAAGGGSIVAISSIAGVLTHRLMGPYCASKAGLEMLIRVAADELGGFGIRANAVRPGLVETDLAAPLLDERAVSDDYRQQMPLGRVGTPDDIGAAVRWLAGPESSWVTGQCLAIDGGHTLRRGPNVEPMMTSLLGADAVRDAAPLGSVPKRP